MDEPDAGSSVTGPNPPPTDGPILLQPPPGDGRIPATSRRGRVITFVITAYALAWLVALPMYLDPALRRGPTFTVASSAMMFTPTLALLISHRVFPADYRLRDLLGLNPGHPRRWLKPALIGWLGIPLASIAALGLAALTGIYHADLHGFSGYRESLVASGTTQAARLPIAILVVVNLASAPIAALIPNTLFTAGEEFGWRGYLQPELRRLHPRTGVVLTGVIWGLWHAPLLLLGYNFPALSPPLRLLFMVVACILLSGILGVLRRAAGTVWVAAVTHGALNAWSGVGVLLADGKHSYHFELAGILGICGWATLAVFYLVLRLTLNRQDPV